MPDSQIAINIEPFSNHETQAIGQLISSIQREEYEIPITLAQQPDLAAIPEFYQKGNGNFWVAVSEGTVVGTIALLDIGNHQVALRKMFVHKDFRGSKIGTAQLLLDASLTWCRSRAVTDIILGTTAKFLAAHRFYEKNGFQEITKPDLPASFPVLDVDSKFYRRAFG